MVHSSKVIAFTSQLFQNINSAKDKAEGYKLVIAEFDIKLTVLDPQKIFSIIPIAHHLTKYNEGDVSEYEIYVIDREFFEHVLPDKCWEPEDILYDSSISGFIEENIYTSLESINGNLFLVDHSAKRGVKIFNLESDIYPDWEYCYPLRKILINSP